MPTLAEIAASPLGKPSIHEISHAFFAMTSCSMVEFDLFPESQEKWSGQTRMHTTCNDKYFASAYGWAGVMGEAIEAHRKYAIALALDRYQNQRPSISDTDLGNIESVGPELQVKAAETAYQTLLARWDEIKALQNQVFEVIEREKLSRVTFVWKQGGSWKKG